jgi:peptide chain release factor 3
MTLEQQRGVSITSSVMQFDFQGLRVNLLDTPGHKDFGEDTYRTLIAADCAAMLIDAAKGVEAQTRKLYEVCRLRRIPIFTFANKMDREGKDPLALIDDVETTLGIKCYPVTWPIGMGDRFKGLYHRLRKQLLLFERGRIEPEVVPVSGWDDLKIAERVGEEFYNQLQEEMELLEVAIGDFNQQEFFDGQVSPMTFGSAKHNWGVDLFLELFAAHAPPPAARHSTAGMIEPQNKNFSGFVFKIQANMDRKHRDRVAFLRICSGKFERGMKVEHTRLHRELRLAYANQFLARERETVDDAYPGDIVGLIDTGYFQIGDTIIGGGKEFQFDPIPRFSPEIFGRLSIKDPLKRKTLQKGVQQLAEEGTIQLLYDPLVGKQDPVVGVVGELQFDVLLFRLNDEYQLDVRLDRLPFTAARWPVNAEGQAPKGAIAGGAKIYHDENERPVVLLEKEWDLNWLKKENPTLDFRISAT